MKEDSSAFCVGGDAHIVIRAFSKTSLCDGGMSRKRGEWKQSEKQSVVRNGVGTRRWSRGQREDPAVNYQQVKVARKKGRREKPHGNMTAFLST